jgi:hypothetical protein
MAIAVEEQRKFKNGCNLVSGNCKSNLTNYIYSIIYYYYYAIIYYYYYYYLFIIKLIVYLYSKTEQPGTAVCD